MVAPMPRVQMPSAATKGEIFQVKAIISHQMETGLRKDHEGNVIPRLIINKFVCRYNGVDVFIVDMHQAKACAFAIAAALTGSEQIELHLFNTCFTLLAPNDAVSDAISFKPVGGSIKQSMPVDLMLPAAEKIVLVLEGIGDGKIRLNSSSLDHPLTIPADHGIEIVAIEKKVINQCQ